MKQLFVNNVATALVGDLAASDGVLTVANGAALPALAAGEFFLLTLILLDTNGNEVDWEIVKVTARSGNTLTIDRHQEGTSARGWLDGTLVEARLTAGGMNGKENVIPAGTAAQFWRGDKTWQDLAVAVRASVLTGLSAATATAAAATDSVLTAIGKLQGQINALATGKLDATANAVSATKLATARTLTLGGSGKTFDGSANVSWTLAEMGAAPLASPAFTGTPTMPTAAAGTSTTQGASTAFVQEAVGGYLSKAVTGGTVVLTATEASNPVIGLSGALTSNLILEIPVASQRIYSISNGTTGAFTVTIKVTGLTPTVLVAQGKRNLVYTNGVGAYDAINDFDAIALTGVSTCVTAAVGTNTTQIASTAYTVAEIGSRAPTKTGVGASGSWAIAITGNAASATTLGGLTATIAELNYMDGVTSNVQTQLNGKAASSHTHGYWTPDTSITGWYRSSGSTGWFNETNGGGIYMADTTWVRVYNSKAFYVANQIAATGNITAYYSDERLKENIRPIANALEAVSSLRGMRYNANALAESFGYDRNKAEVGLLAQEVQRVMPEAVERAPFDIDGETGGSLTGEDYLTLKYERLVPLLVEAIKELRQEVAELRAQLGGA